MPIRYTPHICPEVEPLEPIILDCTLDYDGTDFFARDDIDHNVDLPDDQVLVVDTGTGQLTTIEK